MVASQGDRPHPPAALTQIPMHSALHPPAAPRERSLAIRRLLAFVGALLVGWGLVPRPAAAVEVAGSARVSVGSNEVDGAATDIVDQQYSLRLFQPLTPYLSLRFSDAYLDLSSQLEGLAETGRTSHEPRFELLYDRDRISAGVSYADRRLETVGTDDSIDISSLLGFFIWTPRRGPAVSLRVSDEANASDLATFGRDTDTQTLDAEVVYGREHWTAGYEYRQQRLDNETTGLRLEDARHGLRLEGARRFFSERLALAAGGRVERLDRSASDLEGADLAEPVPARVGLFAVDPSPEVGTLEAVPSLVDGDLVTAADPPIDIGGANTFRNVGVDLGVTRPVSRLEVWVDTATGAGVAWRVYHSVDGLLWEEIPGATADLEADLARYTLRFPETVDRFFKAVNVSANPAVTVQVTEVRALRDVDRLSALDGEETFYTFGASAAFAATERISGDVRVSTTEGENLLGERVQRHYRDLSGTARVDVDLPAELRFRTSYTTSTFEELQEGGITRIEDRYDAGLLWDPLPTVAASLIASWRDESDESEPIRSTNTVRLRVSTLLLPDLELVSELEQTDIEDFLADRDQSVRAWRELLEARPTPNWTISGGWSRLEYDEATGASLLDRTAWELRTTWRATAYLSLAADWDWSQDNTQTTIRQRYALTYSPGTKLSLSASWQDYDAEDLRQTTTAAASLSYRLNARFSLFGNLTRSEDQGSGSDLREVTSFRAGLSLFF